MTTPKVITRFAPSPTGFLHIGGARTALFNYYFAKHMGGEFHLRIEDTDKARSTAEATQAIIDGMNWLGVHHDGEIESQSNNAEAHVAAAYELLRLGFAYKCFVPTNELDELKETHNKKQKMSMDENDGICKVPGFYTNYRYESLEDSIDKPFVIRFKSPHPNHRDWQSNDIRVYKSNDVFWHSNDSVDTMVIHETVRTGHAVSRTLIDDFILLRSDGSPTYMLAVVVDDLKIGVSHVIRGEDHFFNAYKQTLIYRSLGKSPPIWAHVPLIHGPDGKKLSKRHGALGVEKYKEMGYLPSGMRNYLIRLGWSHGDKEIYLDEEVLVEDFTLQGINTSPARLDFDKMDFINGQHILDTSNESLLKQAETFLTETNEGPLSEPLKQRVLLAMDTLKPRSKTLKELAEQARYLMLKRPLEITGKTAKPLKKEDAISHLSALTLRLKSLEEANWSETAIQTLLQDYVSEHDIGFGKIGQPVRAALTGGAPSPDLSWVLTLLGKDETLARLEDVITSDFAKD